MKNIRIFYLKIFIFLLVKFSVCFNRRVFVMIQMIILLYLRESICCGYPLETPQRGISNEYLQHMVSWRNKKHAGKNQQATF